MQSLEQIDIALEKVREAGDANLRPCPLVTNAFDPIPPHRVGVTHLIYKPRFLLLDPTGTGKTPQTLVAFAYLKQAHPEFKAIVCTRKSALFQWDASVQRFLTGLRSEVVGYDPNDPSVEWNALKRREQYERFIRGETDVLIASYHTIARDWTVESISARGGSKRVDSGKARDWIIDPKILGTFALVLDEVQTCKARMARTVAPAMRLLSREARYCWGLTATPIMSRLDDLYGIVETVRPGTLGNYFDDFAPHYLKRIKIPLKGSKFRHFYKIIGHQNLPHLMARLHPFYLQRGIDDFVFFLAAVTIESLIVDLDAKQRGVYDTIRRQFFPSQDDTEASETATRIDEARRKAEKKEARQAAEEGRAVQPVTLPKLTSLVYAQLAVDAPRVLGVDVPSAKLTELLRYLDEDAATEKVIVYTRFEQVATMIHTALTEAGIKATRITGKESGGTRRKAQEAFMTDPETRVICLTSAGGEAIDLQAARILVYYDLPWSWGEFTQVLGRARRQGSPHQSLLVILLGTLNTIDTHTLTLLQAKEKLINSTFTLPTLYLSGASFEDTDTTSTVSFSSSVPGLGDETLTVNSSIVNDLFNRVRPTHGRD